MLYNFSYRDISKDYEHLYCMRIVLLEQEPTVQGVQQMLHELHVQRRIRPEILMMAPQDLEDMSKRFTEEHINNHPLVAYYFTGKLAEREIYPPFYGKEIKQIENTYIYALPSLEHRVVMAGFMPVLIG